MKIDSNYRNNTLQAMLQDGAYIYKAVYQREIVGVVIIIRLTREFFTSMSSLRTPSLGDVSLPNLSDLEAVEEYAISDGKNKYFLYQLCGYLNSRVRSYGPGKLWGKHPSPSLSCECYLRVISTRIICFGSKEGV